MVTSWRQWCRLCAGEHSTIDIFFKNENNWDVSELIRKFFQITVSPLDEAPVTICTSCYQFLVAVARFADRVTKVESMYSSIVYDEINSIDFSSLKYQFGLVKEEPQPYTYEKCDQSTDTIDLNIEFMPTEMVQYCDDDGKSVAEINFKIADENASEDIEEKSDPLVHQLYSPGAEADENDSVGEMCVDYLTDEGSCNTDDDEYKKPVAAFLLQKSEDETANTRKRKGRKRKEPPFQCNKCEKSFLQKNALRYHKRVAHTSGEKKEYACKQCDKKFPTLRRAQQHEVVHLDPDQKPAFPCPHCEKSFTKTTNLQTHIRTIHVGERPFICETCGKSFATKGALKEHNYTHMDETPFQCSSCPKKFKTLPRLKTHEDIHNGTMYVCPNCGLILNTKRTLQMHMVVHSDQKKHKCTICNSEFKRAKALKNHLILHSGLRPYTCPFCDKTFANGSNCRSHKKKAHPTELAEMEAAGEVCRATNIPKLEQLRAS